MESTVLILGARGRFGLAAARAFAGAGWRVLGQMRPGAAQPPDVDIEWMHIDLHDTPALAAAARGASVVVHALNPAYTNQVWREQVLPMTQAAIAVTRMLAATLMVPGNVYNFGASMPGVLREDTLQAAHTVKGQVRMAMEARLEHAGVRAVVIRAGDFFGSGQGSWFDKVLVKGLARGVFTYPGQRDVATAWAYLPDLARAFVAVAQRREQLQPFEVLHFAGYSLTDRDWLQVLEPVARARGWIGVDAGLKRRRLPWSVLRLGGWLVPAWKALVEMRYLWDTPHALANDKLVALIGAEPHTPLAQAASQAMIEQGLMEATAAAAARHDAQMPSAPGPGHRQSAVSR